VSFVLPVQKKILHLVHVGATLLRGTLLFQRASNMAPEFRPQMLRELQSNPADRAVLMSAWRVPCSSGTMQNKQDQS
jgi:hypothetical protein